MSHAPPFLLAALVAAAAGSPRAEAVLHDAAGKDIGRVQVEETVGAIRFRAELHDVPAGEHGFHVHANSECGEPPFEAAGPHFDPANAGRHSGPLGNGHAGDLGNVVIDARGKGKLDLITRRMDLGSDSAGIVGKAVILHAQRDNLTDTPPNGGSGARIACGVITTR